MQANDMMQAYDDRDDFEIAKARLAYKKHTRAQTYFTITSPDDDNRINSSGKHRQMLAAYITWWKSLRDQKKRNITIVLTLWDGHGTIIRRVTMKKRG